MDDKDLFGVMRQNTQLQAADEVILDCLNTLQRIEQIIRHMLPASLPAIINYRKAECMKWFKLRRIYPEPAAPDEPDQFYVLSYPDVKLNALNELNHIEKNSNLPMAIREAASAECDKIFSWFRTHHIEIVYERDAWLIDSYELQDDQ